MCDPQIGMGGYDDDMVRFNLAVDKINRMQPDFVIVCGDLVHHAHDSAYDDFEEVINKLEVPYLLAPGNHDLGNIPSDSSLQAYRSRFGDDYFVSHYGEVSMVVINTQLIKENVKLASDLQMKWIASMLDSLAHTKQKVFVMGHYPLFIKEVNEEENYFNLPDNRRTTLLELFESSGVLAYLSGHKHELLTNEYAGIFLVSGETTSKNFDERPFGFRKWSVQKCRITHEFVPL
ncbi:metallophosphoesterase [Marinoscillum sp.]|uniref:metallophosphoesterase n=1 Tax=Marinoscillum sp. TaxID=2024838 RepID=UPI003BA90CEE